MKKLKYVLSLMVLLVSAPLVAESVKLVRVGYPAAGLTTLSPLEDRQRIVYANFLTDAFKRAEGVAAVNEERSGSIFKRIRSGAIDYGTDDMHKIYSSYLPVDVVIDFKADNEANTITAEVFWSDGRKSVTAAVKERNVDDLYSVCGKLISLIEECPVFSAAQKKTIRDLWKERAQIFYPYYFTPNLRGHYTDNTGEYKWNCALEAFSAQKGVGPMASRICDAGHDTMWDTRKCGKLSKVKAGNMAALAFVNSLDSGEDDIIRKMAVHYPQLVEKDTFALAKRICTDAEERLLDDVLDTDMQDDMDDQLEDLDSNKNVHGGINADDSKCRRALVACGWMNIPSAWALLQEGAKSKDVLTRIAAAEGMASATNAATLVTLARLAEDKDPALASMASLSLILRGAKPPASAAAKARKIVDKRLYTRAALETLVAVGSKSDLEIFMKYRLDGDMFIRSAALAGIVTHDSTTGLMNSLLDDPDARVTARILKLIGKGGVDVKSRHYDRFIAFANDASSTVSDAARAALELKKPAGGDELIEYELNLEHPLVRRRILSAAAKKGDAKSKALLEKSIMNANPQTRAYAIDLLGRLDPELAYKYVIEAAGDRHGWVRFYAAVRLAETAKAKDAAKIKEFLAKEKMRGTKLYFEDALAKAEGRPKPPPQKSVNTAFPKDGRALMWLCGTGGEDAADGPYEAFYTCAPPQWNEDIQRAHDKGRVYFPRPTPIGDPSFILTDEASADTFWTRLLDQMPDNIADVTDGVVYGEESMGISTGQDAFDKAWRLFCREAGLDVKRVDGELSNLTKSEKSAWSNWIRRIGVEGFNILYDFTKDYFGKIHPGFSVCTWIPSESGIDDPEMKFDVLGAYIYDGDFRQMYSKIRSLKTIWPERPLLWLSFGNVNLGLGGSVGAKPITWKVDWPTKPVRYRFDHPYADNFVAWFAGADPGFFVSYSTNQEDDFDACSWVSFPMLHVYRHPSLEPSIVYAYKGTYGRISDMMKDANKKEVDVSMEESGDDELEDLSLEEKGGSDDPVMKKQKEYEERMRRGFVFCARSMRDAAVTQRSLPRRFPKRQASALISGASPYSPAGLLLPEFDVYINYDTPVEIGALKDYKLLVCGARAQMSESARKAWVEYIRDTPAVIVFNGAYPETKGGARSSIGDIRDDLETPWPWEADVKYVAKDNRKGKDAHYIVKDGAPVEIIEKNSSGVARLVWRGKGMKSIVIFDLLTGAANSEAIRTVAAKHFAANSVDFKFASKPGLFEAQTSTGLKVTAQCAWGGITAETVAEGCDLLTGQWQAKVTARLPVAATSDDYVSPYVIIHGGVSVLAEDMPLKLLEKLPNGVKVEVDGLVRVTTRSRRLAKISGAPLKEEKDGVDFFVKGKTGGIATLKASNAPEIISTEGRIDNMPDARIFRAKGVFTITEN